MEETLAVALVSAADAAAFITLPGAERAIQVRLWDDAAKIAGQPTPSLGHFAAIMAAAARGSRA